MNNSSLLRLLGGVSGGVPGGRKNSFDATASEHGFLGPNARNSVQYRSLPRPAKSSTLSLIGRPSLRTPSSSIDGGLLSLKPLPSPGPPRSKDPSGGSSKVGGRASSGPVNLTDREKEKERAKAKAVASDGDCGSLKRESSHVELGEACIKLHGLRRTSSSKYPELASPTTPRYTHTHIDS